MGLVNPGSNIQWHGVVGQSEDTIILFHCFARACFYGLAYDGVARKPVY